MNDLFHHRWLVPFVAAALAAAPASGTPDRKNVREEMTRQLVERAEAPVGEWRVPTAARGVAAGVSLFSMTGADNASCVRSIPDVTGDGLDEVVVGIDESGVDNIFVLDGASSGTATEVWAIETLDGVSGGSPYGDLSITPASDADGNGHPNLLVGTAWGGRTAYSLDGLDGTIHWRFDTYSTPDSGWVYALAEVDDMTGDGVPEVAIGVGSDSDSAYLINGAVAAGQAPFVWRFGSLDAVLAVCNAGDLGRDGNADVLAAVGDFGEELAALDAVTGLPRWRYDAGASVFACGSLPDLDDDGVPEALAAVWVSDGSAIRAVNGATGVEQWASTEVFGPGMLVDLIPDLDGDRVPDVVASSWDDAVTVLSGADGTTIWKTTLGDDVWTARGIGDLTGDGGPDVIAGSFDRHVYALDGVDGTVLWAFDTGNRVFSVYPVGDLTGDGRPEVVVGTQDTTSNVVVYVLDGAAGEVGIFSDGFESGDTTGWSSVP